MRTQREIFIPQQVLMPQRAADSVIEKFASYRDAVLWCWENRVNTGLGEKTDQAIFANFVGMHSPHMSRCVNPNTKAPMDMPIDHKSDFERYTGWLAITQWLCKRDGITPMEWVLEDRRVA